jgi:hypothetical protein
MLAPVMKYSFIVFSTTWKPTVFDCGYVSLAMPGSRFQARPRMKPGTRVFLCDASAKPPPVAVVVYMKTKT